MSDHIPVLPADCADLERVIQLGIDSAENEPLLDHEEVFAGLNERLANRTRAADGSH